MWRSARGARRDSQSGDAVTGRRSPTGPECRSSDLVRGPGRRYTRGVPRECDPSRSGPFENGLARCPANYAPLTPTGFLERAAAVYPGKPAVIHDDRVFTYAEFSGRSRRLASALARRGIGVGDTVAVMAPNVPAMLEAHYGVPMVGAVLNALNYRLDARTIAFILQHGGAKLLITDTEFSDTVGAALVSCRGRFRSWTSSIPSPIRRGAAPAWARPTTRSCSPRAIPSTTGRGRPTSGRRWPSSTRRGRRGTRRASCTRTAAPT